MNYEQFRIPVERAALCFFRRYGGSLPDLEQDAWVLFLECAADHDPERSTLEQRAQFCIYRKLLDRRRNELGRYRRKPTTRQLHINEATRAAPRDIISLLVGLSEDAVTVARLILDYDKRPSRYAIRRLARQVGIEPQRIRAGYAELEAVFS